MTFGTFLRSKREEKHLSRPMLSEATGISKETLANWEIGRRNPNESNIAILNEFYGTDLRKEYYSSGKCDEEDKREYLKNILKEEYNITM